MKLYTKSHIFLSIFLTSLFMILLCFGFFTFFEKNQTKPENTSISEIQNQQSELIASESHPENTIKDSDNALLNTVYSQGYSQDELENISVYEKYNEAVVNINTAVMGINWFLEPVPQEGGSGSGSIIDSRGYVVTNVHVIEDAYKIYISLSDGTQYEAYTDICKA